ncbi:hypothetical protein BJ138DRAFT_938571 [Hygrophoropsis aurantiaca]|uniref:Uncharacterized protein n=1 Tax=Hygrophoropsis aurantiaca TaxID=72124 RepID=A0ACB7ZUD1_9AGAM|nr:hypothetical protein BJ138DRAFT_938571 [Hygrophoropsis aurantiaca]
MPRTLPDEIFCNIIEYLPIRCILLLRRVSKHLNAITYERSIWTYAYRTSSLVRPPGPFAWQTTHTLESSLIQSARMSLNWPPNDNAAPIRSRRIIKISGHSRKLVLGRWLFTSHDFVRILCYDLDRTDSSSIEEPCAILYECREKYCQLEDMQYAQSLPGERSGDENHPVGFLLVTLYNAGLYTRTLYSVILADEMTPVLHFVLHIPSSALQLDIGPRLLAVFGPSHDLQKALFVDTETYQCYKFPDNPPKNTQLILQDVHDYTKQRIVISSSHVLLFRPYRNQEGTYIQAYAVPSRQGSGSESLGDQPLLSPPLTLQLTHEGTTTLDFGGRCTLLRDSKVGEITKTIHIVIVAIFGSVIPVAVSVKLNPTIQSIGSITVEHPKNTIPSRSFPIYDLLATRSLNGSTRSVGHFQCGGIMHLEYKHTHLNTQVLIHSNVRDLAESQVI